MAFVPLKANFWEECTFSPTNTEFCFGGDFLGHNQKSCRCQNCIRLQRDKNFLSFSLMTDSELTGVSVEWLA